MEYFELVQSKKVENPIELMGLDPEEYCYDMKREQFEQLEKLKVAYFTGREFEEICDILTAPTFLVSDGMKKLLSLYEKKIAFKGVQVFPAEKESRQYPQYWVPCFPEVNCFHKNTVINELGMIEKLVLDQNKIGKRKIFRLPDILQYKVIVSMPVAESILRRRFYGVELKEAEVE